MPEWTIEIASPNGMAETDEHLDAFVESLMSDGRPLHPAASLAAEGALRVEFTVDAPNVDEAAFAACLAYWGALGAAGVTTDEDSRVSVRRDDQAQTFTARASVRRSADA